MAGRDRRTASKSAPVPQGTPAPGREPAPGGGVDQQLEAAILELLANRAATSTICPSEAARAVGGGTWRDLMEPARRAARRLVDAGEVQVTQGGSVVDPSTAKGPIRIRKAR
ncbi:DUF3253 domain-containing protein [Pseudarthrobacter oxydans]|uniref:DUF3253 domain-containing protein n=1 Tax=Pseudarthrobacter oxydans TaxID=1671 RepID=UPI003449808E